MAKLYECRNKACSLGSRDDPGRFSGGISKEGVEVLGLPPDNPTGDGVCPNCGQKGKAV